MIERTVLPRIRPTAPSSSALQSQDEKPPRISRETLQYGGVFLGIALVTLILFLYVLPSSQMSAAEARITELKEEKASLQRMNADVIRSITQYSEQKVLEQRARKLGMGPPHNAVYLHLLAEGSAGKVAHQEGATIESPKVSEKAGERNWLANLDVTGWLESVRLAGSDLVDEIEAKVFP
ncbi:MAG: hypothetical protein U9R25_06910 [Chloroflexota bacterium]|nr:hypothetical protein [Chloroflexota bacterium]